MARTTLYVSDGLKKRMDKAKRHVNWSEIAQVAFERKLGEIAQKKEIKKMSDVVERLRASKRESDSDVEKRGRNDGCEWAKRTAEAAELELLARYRSDRTDYDWTMTFLDSKPSAYSAGEMFFMAITDPSSDGFDRSAASDLWEMIAGDGSGELSRDPNYVRAVAEAAIALWNEVADQV